MGYTGEKPESCPFCRRLVVTKETLIKKEANYTPKRRISDVIKIYGRSTEPPG